MTDTRDRWPALPLAGWRDTCQTLHMYTQEPLPRQVQPGPFLLGQLRLGRRAPVVSALAYPPPSGPSTTFMPQAGAPTEPIPSNPTGRGTGKGPQSRG